MEGAVRSGAVKGLNQMLLDALAFALAGGARTRLPLAFTLRTSAPKVQRGSVSVDTHSHAHCDGADDPSVC